MCLYVFAIARRTIIAAGVVVRPSANFMQIDIDIGYQV